MTEGKIERHVLQIDSSVVVGLIRRAYAAGGEDKAVRIAADCMSGLTKVQIIKIAKSEATLVGCTPNPIEYIELDFAHLMADYFKTMSDQQIANRVLDGSIMLEKLVALARHQMDKLEYLKKRVNEQAEDEGLWFVAGTCPEDYLQQELRKLHEDIERDVAGEYPDGECPDCGYSIPAGAEHGDKCPNCDHVWNEVHDDDDKET